MTGSGPDLFVKGLVGEIVVANCVKRRVMGHEASNVQAELVPRHRGSLAWIMWLGYREPPSNETAGGPSSGYHHGCQDHCDGEYRRGCPKARGQGWGSDSLSTKDHQSRPESGGGAGMTMP